MFPSKSLNICYECVMEFFAITDCKLKFATILGLTRRVFLHLGSVTHQRARPHHSVVKPDVSTPGENAG
jgi:hypothetical protein